MVNKAAPIGKAELERLFIMNDPPIIETVQPIKGAGAFWFTLGAFGLSVAGFWALFQALGTKDIRWLAVSVAAAISLCMLVNRMRAHDKLSVISKFSIPSNTSQVAAPKPLIRPEIQKTSDNGQIIKYGNFALSRDDWQRLGQALFDNQNTIVRDIIPPGIFNNVSRRYPDILAEMQRLGFVNHNKRLTKQGIDWFSKFTPPYPTSDKNVGDRYNGTTAATTAATGGEHE